MHKYGDNWKGTHEGRKMGKTFAKPGNPNKKAQRKLRRRQNAHAISLSKLDGKKEQSLKLNPPGSLNRSNH